MLPFSVGSLAVPGGNNVNSAGPCEMIRARSPCAVDGSTQASSVIWPLNSSDGIDTMLTQVFVPSNAMPLLGCENPAPVTPDAPRVADPSAAASAYAPTVPEFTAG